MLTVTKLARRCGMSRTALLYYESIGLMPAAERSSGNYRCYGETDVRRLEQIRAYRDAGLRLNDIRVVLDRPGGDALRVLERRLLEIDGEIGALRAHQQAILKMLRYRPLRRAKMITKEKWVSIMKGCGLSDEQCTAGMRSSSARLRLSIRSSSSFCTFRQVEIGSIREESRKAV